MAILESYKYNPIPIILPNQGIHYYQRYNRDLKLVYKIFSDIETLHIDTPLRIHQLIGINKHYFKMIYWPPIYFHELYETFRLFKNVEFKNIVFDALMMQQFDYIRFLNVIIHTEENENNEKLRLLILIKYLS